jgi:hypothetical protein
MFFFFFGSSLTFDFLKNNNVCDILAFDKVDFFFYCHSTNINRIDLKLSLNLCVIVHYKENNFQKISQIIL